MKTNTVWKVVALFVALVVVLFGGLGITGAAAQAAIPGDALYPVKTTIESARLSLARDAGDRAQMKLAFAEERLTEISRLIREGRYREIREVVLAFEANIHAAIMELESVSAGDPARATQLSQELVSALTRYAQTLSELAALAPESVKPEVARALDTTQIASGLPRSSGNENESENENSNTNANDNSSIDDSNVNSNEDSNTNVNSNDDDSSNENEDRYFDDNSNSSNTNDDDLYDDKHNSNSSVEDSNTNSSYDDSSDDDSSKSNDNSSQDDNSNDDHSDDNDNSDDNSSDDGNSNSDDDGGGNDNGGGGDD